MCRILFLMISGAYAPGLEIAKLLPGRCINADIHRRQLMSNAALFVMFDSSPVDYPVL